MDRTLLLLSLLRFKAGARKLKRTLFTIKGALLMGASLTFFGLLILPGLFFGRLEKAGETPPSPSQFLHPAALFGLWLATAVSGRVKSPLAFSLAEVEFLFPGPFSRRRLLIYKLLGSAAGALGFALLVPLLASRVLPWWLSAFLGVWWTMNFMQMSTVFMALGFDWFGARFRKWRWPVAAALAVVVTATLWSAGALEADLALTERLRAVDANWLVRAVLAPFVAFNHLILAETADELFAWGAAALAMNVVVFLGILRLDANFLEASLLASQRRYDWLERVKRSGGVPSWGNKSRPSFSVPQFPRFRGAGPIAWRQLLGLVRGSSRLIFITPIIIGPLIGVMLARQNANPRAVETLLSTTMLLSFFITTIMPLGIRNDLDHVDLLKTLPISPGAIVWGSIASAILYTTLFQVLATGAVALLAGHWSLMVSVVLAFTLPINLLMVVYDSLMVLLYPSAGRLDPGDVLAGMRLMLANVAKMLFVSLAVGIAGLAALPVYLLWGDARTAMALIVWSVLLAEGIAAVWVAGLLFERFDPSIDAAERE